MMDGPCMIPWTPPSSLTGTKPSNGMEKAETATAPMESPAEGRSSMEQKEPFMSTAVPINCMTEVANWSVKANPAEAKGVRNSAAAAICPRHMWLTSLKPSEERQNRTRPLKREERAPFSATWPTLLQEQEKYWNVIPPTG